jgi:hypothetical protein
MAMSVTTVCGAIGNTCVGIAASIQTLAPGQYVLFTLVIGGIGLAAKQMQAVYTLDKVPTPEELLHKTELLKGVSEEVQDSPPENKPKEGL